MAPALGPAVNPGGEIPPRPVAAVRDDDGSWLLFYRPRRRVAALRVERVVEALTAVERAVERLGLHAAGFVSYEAAPAFDPALATRPPDGFPLVWFDLFDPPVRADSLPTPPPNDGATPRWQASLTQEEYRRNLAIIRDLIRDGHTYQVNFTWRQRARLTGDPWHIFLGLVDAHDPPAAAYIDTGRWVAISASPELFFQLDGRRIESRPMKGTAPRGLGTEDDDRLAAALASSTKEKAENVMIVDMVRNDLGRVAETGSVEVPVLRDVERHPSVWQMTSTVRALTDAPLAGLFGALFPPASVTGAPKARTMAVIAEVESSPRRLYTGAIGFASPGRRARFSVAIRTILLDRKNRSAEYGVGGGIVWDSNPGREWQECLVKSRVLRPTPPPFDLLETLLWTSRGGFWLLDRHLARLAGSARYFGFAFHEGDARRLLERFAGALPAGLHRVRLLLARRGGMSIEATPLARGAFGFPDIALAVSPIEREDPLLYHKTTHRRVYETARAARAAFGDVLLYNRRGEVTESTRANVVIDLGGTLCTPPVECGLLPGTMRGMLLERRRIVERRVTVDEALASRGVYLVNGVRGMHRVSVFVPGADRQEPFPEPR
jgi:para-aminobenzoate synthetase/4-amino-4-deoxychorismate lyase